MADNTLTLSKMGYARYRPKLREGTTEINLPAGFTAHTDATSNLLVNFTITYEWTSSTNCKISKIAWKPGKIVLNSENVREIVDESFTANSPFIVAGKAEVKIGGSTPENFPTNISAAARTISNLNLNYPVNQQYLLCDFTYSNVIDAVDNDVNGEYSQIEYYIEIKNIKIPKTTKYEHNVVFTQDGLTEFITNIKKYPIVGIEEITNSTTWNNYTEGKPCLKVTYGDTTRVFSGYKKANGTDQTQTTTGFQYVPVGSNITFPNETLPLPSSQATGTIRITINGVVHEIPVYGLSGTGSGGINLNGTTTVAGHLLPAIDSQTASSTGYNLGNSLTQWNILYARAAVFGNADEEDGKSDAASNIRPYGNFTGNLGTANHNWDSLYSNCGIFTSSTTLEGAVAVVPHLTLKNSTFTKGNDNPNSADDGYNYYGAIYFGDSELTYKKKDSLARIISYQYPNYPSSSNNYSYRNEPVLELNCFENATESTTACTLKLVYQSTSTIPSTVTSGSYYSYNARGHLNGVFQASKVFNAVFNDYAEYRNTIDLAPGHVVIDNDDGSLSCSSQRLQPGAQVISDTFGHSMGETDTAKTPLAVAGRVLVYTYQPRENYHAGMAVCSAPNGTIDIMTREEIRDYPDCIVGIVSEIPQYETWGSDNIKVDGRIWIKVK